MKRTETLLKNMKRLSLKSDSFVLIEYIEKNPLILSNKGMGSRIHRCIYLTRFA